MSEGLQKALWIAIPVAFATGITLIPGPAVWVQFIAYGILALVAMVGIWIINARKHRLEREEAEAERIKEERQSFAEMRELLKQNTIMTCRMAIYNDHFSVDEKISAYIIYRKQGQNHHTKKYMDELVGCDIDEYIERHGITS
jgi:uncharacterized membrane protein YhiD involved in acid resistance